MFAPPICRRRRRNTLLRSVGSDEDGVNPANIAASGASNQTERDAQLPKRNRTRLGAISSAVERASIRSFGHRFRPPDARERRVEGL